MGACFFLTCGRHPAGAAAPRDRRTMALPAPPPSLRLRPSRRPCGQGCAPRPRQQARRVHGRRGQACMARPGGSHCAAARGPLLVGHTHGHGSAAGLPWRFSPCCGPEARRRPGATCPAAPCHHPAGGPTHSPPGMRCHPRQIPASASGRAGSARSVPAKTCPPGGGDLQAGVWRVGAPAPRTPAAGNENRAPCGQVLAHPSPRAGLRLGSGCLSASLQGSEDATHRGGLTHCPDPASGCVRASVARHTAGTC
jgi:hypothetical protein